MKFENWLAALLGERASDVEQLLNDETALHFLIAWSVFESKCFNGYVKVREIEKYAERIVDESFDVDTIRLIAKYFHDRYQDGEKYANLMHGQCSKELEGLLGKSFDELRPCQIVYLATMTIYRYRNNIFHGNKRVAS